MNVRSDSSMLDRSLILGVLCGAVGFGIGRDKECGPCALDCLYAAPLYKLAER